MPQLRLVVLEHDLGEHMSRYLADRIEQLPDVEVLLHSRICECTGDRALEAVVVEDTDTGERREVAASFFRAGVADRPGTAPLLLETSVPGVFAAGDVRSGSTPRVSAAVGDGATAIRLVHQSLGGRMTAARPAAARPAAARPAAA